ncbi:hypothetical protein MMC06_000311 [Schaereria dolodes]|nr:hypothetical protein [Schaereria dolodes]
MPSAATVPPPTLEKHTLTTAQTRYICNEQILQEFLERKFGRRDDFQIHVSAPTSDPFSSIKRIEDWLDASSIHSTRTGVRSSTFINEVPIDRANQFIAARANVMQSTRLTMAIDRQFIAGLEEQANA